LLVCILSLISIAPTQTLKASVRVRQTGTDAVGPLLKQALQNEFKKSGYSDADQAKTTSYFIELVTLDAGAARDGKSSFVSVVISSIIPGGWPTPYQWYHKVMLVKEAEVPQIAARIVKDMQASVCNISTSSLSPCPAEEPWPGVPQSPDNRLVQPSRARPVH
jgi:hypothetical protein